jgi:peptide-methionine (S)-S-oxide reductase
LHQWRRVEVRGRRLTAKEFQMTDHQEISRKRALPTLAISALVLLVLAWQLVARSAEQAVTIPAAAIDEPASDARLETAVVAGGCFWGVQGVFQHVKGVTSAISGYAGGAAATARYEDVGTGMTGHAESVQITFDPKQVTYGQLLRVYFSVAHDPTQLNRQGPDSGTQYRSAIFPANDSQRKVAIAYIGQLQTSGAFSRPIVTAVEPGKTFYAAEGYHQDFLTLNPTYPYIVFNDLPKVDHLKQMFPDLYRPQPVLVSDRPRPAAGPRSS